MGPIHLYMVILKPTLETYMDVHTSTATCSRRSHSHRRSHLYCCVWDRGKPDFCHHTPWSSFLLLLRLIFGWFFLDSGPRCHVGHTFEFDVVIMHFVAQELLSSSATGTSFCISYAIGYYHHLATPHIDFGHEVSPVCIDLATCLCNVQPAGRYDQPAVDGHVIGDRCNMPWSTVK